MHIDIVTMATSLINHFCDVCEEEVEKLITVNLLFLVPTLLACRWISYLITNISTFQFDPELVDKVNH